MSHNTCMENDERKEIKLRTLDQVEDLINERLVRVGTIMDDYDGGQQDAFKSTLKDLTLMRAIIEHVHNNKES